MVSERIIASTNMICQKQYEKNNSHFRAGSSNCMTMKLQKEKSRSAMKGERDGVWSWDYSHYPLISETSHLIYLSVTLEISPLS